MNGRTATLLIAGTASHVGKSTVAAGLCRLLADRGVDVAPYKAQNMSNNARAVPKSGGSGNDDAAAPSGFGEIGVSQYVQARAARVRPETDHNPVLLKPRGEGESQLVVDGEAVAHYAASDYFEDHWHDARAAAVAAHERLAAEHDVVVAEGAGSIAEINLRHRDLANVETARFADAEILLVADVERGGVFASLVGTLELMPGDLRERVAGAVITKFRGDESLLAPGVEEFEERTDVPVLGVLPFDDPELPEEDSVALPAEGERAVRGDDDGVPADRAVTIAVPRLPRISNFTDLEPLAAEPGVRVAYVPLDDPLDGADAVVLPGTKNAVDDLLAARDAGFDDALRAFDGPVAGLCGGYQLLGERILNADVEGTGPAETVKGFGLLPVETAFSPEKRVVATEHDVDGIGPLSGASGSLAGYEIHMGETRLVDAVSESDVSLPFANDGTSSAALGAAIPSVVGSYLHGLFENPEARTAFINAAYDAADRDRPASADDDSTPCDRAAELVREHVDVDRLGL